MTEKTHNVPLTIRYSFFHSTHKVQTQTDQFLLTIDPAPLSNAQFESRLEALLEAILLQPGTRLPGSQKPHLRDQAQKDGISIDATLHQSLMELQKRP